MYIYCWWCWTVQGWNRFPINATQTAEHCPFFLRERGGRLRKLSIAMLTLKSAVLCCAVWCGVVRCGADVLVIHAYPPSLQVPS